MHTNSHTVSLPPSKQRAIAMQWDLIYNDNEMGMFKFRRSKGNNISGGGGRGYIEIKKIS